MLHLNIRAVCDEGRGRLCLERFDEFFAVHFWAPVRQMTYIVRTNLAPEVYEIDHRNAMAEEIKGESCNSRLSPATA